MAAFRIPLIFTTLLIIVTGGQIALGACFKLEHSARIEYQYNHQIVSPMPGFVTWPPVEGRLYNRIDLAQPQRYMIMQNQTSDVVAYITNEALRARERLAEIEESYARSALGRGRTMSAWQSHMRVHEDFLFALQQGQNVPMRQNTEPVYKIEQRVDKFAKTYTKFNWGSDSGEYSRKASVNLRLNYSDYMRAFELPQFTGNLQLALDTSTLQNQMVEGERQLGMITCQEQCRVVKSFVRKDQRVNEGDVLATVVSPFHKKIIIEVPPTHILAYLDTQDNQVRITVLSHIALYRFRDLSDIPDEPEDSSASFTGYLLKEPILNEEKSKVTLEFSLVDEGGSSEINLNPINHTTMVRIVPEQFADANEVAQRLMEESIERISLTCE